MTRRRMAWRESAACAGARPEYFTPGMSRNSPIPDVAWAAAEYWCARCPVIAECGAEADRDQPIGLWGGVFRIQPSHARRDYKAIPLLPIEAAA